LLLWLFLRRPSSGWVDPGNLDDAGKAFRERVLQQLWNWKRRGESLLSLFLGWSVCPLQDDGITIFLLWNFASFLPSWRNPIRSAAAHTETGREKESL